MKINNLWCNTGKKFPIGRNANYLTLGHSQVLTNVAWPKGPPCHENSALPLPKEPITKGGWPLSFSTISFCRQPRGGFYPLEWSWFEEGVVYSQKPPTRKSLV